MKTRFVTIVVLAGLGCALAWAQADIDFNRARELAQKMKAGKTLTQEEREFLMRAKEARQGKTGKMTKALPSEVAPPTEAPALTLASKVDLTALIPLTEMTSGETYKGQDGGLYGGGRNDPPAAHRDAALKAAAKIQPLDKEGRPSPDGKIVLLGVGMSNTTQEYRRFKEIADADRAKSPRVVVVDGAQGGQDARITSDFAAEFWPRIDERLEKAGVTAKQVQAIWLKQAVARPEGDFYASGKRFQEYLTSIVGILKNRYPNARLCYISSRTYAGYAVTPLNPEPYAYEGAFAVRSLIAEQIAGDAALNYDPAKGEVRAPLLLWGPYLWAQGETARKADGLAYRRADFTEKDGTHPSASGQQKVAEQLLKFFKTEPTAKGWFVGEGKR